VKAVRAGSVAAAKRMEAGSFIIHVSSIEAFNPSPTNGPYAAAKAGVHALTKTLSKELAPNIRVNAIAPGPVPTEVFLEATGLTMEAMPMVAQQLNIPMGRMGAEEDMAPAAIYLASEASSWITGQVLTVSGGL